MKKVECWACQKMVKEGVSYTDCEWCYGVVVTLDQEEDKNGKNKIKL